MLIRFRTNIIFSTVLLIYLLAYSGKSILAIETDIEINFSNPLSIRQALLLANSSHPDLTLTYAKLNRAKSKKLEAQSLLGINAYIEISPTTVNPTAHNNYIDDSYARLYIGKTLLDFGVAKRFELAAEADIASQEKMILSARLNHNVKIMENFYSVILSDLRYNVDNEELARRFVSYDRLRERHRIGQISDIELLVSENSYREAQVKTSMSEQQRQSTRQSLATQLNHPTELPNELVWPKFKYPLKKIPDSDEIFNLAITSNPVILAQKHKIDSAKKRLKAERARNNPIITGALELNKYSRNLPGRSDASIGISIRIPIHQGGRIKAAIARAASDLSVNESQLLQLEYVLRQSCLELVQKLKVLHVDHKTSQQRLAFRDRNLDMQRALYEMELQTTLGNAMTKTTEAQWQATKVDVDISLTWARINALMGKPIIDVSEDVR